VALNLVFGALVRVQGSTSDKSTDLGGRIFKLVVMLNVLRDIITSPKN
jgi:hypothetical protein